MTILAKKINKLMGPKTVESVVRDSELSRQAFGDMMKGQKVKLSTLMRVADTLNATRHQKNELVQEWIKIQIGRELTRWFIIAPRRWRA